ncbi:hypothetical protein [Archangium lansingense]|uniref:Uncharacterized protein n=1 Tax=Archangium lansingense TaxID=2995310 RepID=A0ABT3ZXH3_9BACT|nr:hypothetical protein [Archangium lansinium]MCY1074103.1 hypothetical protein [Archangium lansinium]
MDSFTAGMLVEHASLGPGKVIAAKGDMLHVFFPSRNGHAATRIKLDPKRPLLRPAARQSDPWLDHLPPFVLKDGTYQLAHERLTQPQAIGHFKQVFPLGFNDPAYEGNLQTGERHYKVAAHKAFNEAFGGGKAEQLLAEGKVAELTHRLLHIDAKTNLLHPNWDKAPLRDGLKDEQAAERFHRTLFALLALPEPTQSAFEDFVGALDALPAPGSAVATWPVTTVFLYLAQPDRHMFFRPKYTQEAAQRLGYELNYAPHPNWRTYSSLHGFSRLLLEELKPLGARDFIDVQSFIYVTAGGSGYDK